MKQANRAARLIFLAFGLGISSWAPMVPFAKQRLDFDDAQLGMILLVCGIGSLGTMPFASWLIHRFGSRFITMASGLFVSVLLPFLALAATPVTLSTVLFFFGACTGVLNVAINAQAVAIESKGTSSMMSGLHCLFSTGGLLGAFIVSLLLELNIPLPLCAGVISIAMILLLMTQERHLLPRNLEEKEKAPNQKRSFVFPGINVFLLGIFCFIAFMSEGSMLDWSAEFLHTSLNYKPALAGIGYALFSISMAIGRLIGDRLIQRTNIFMVFQGGSLLAACGFAIVVYLSFNYIELIGFCLIGLGCSNIVPILFSSSGRIDSISPSAALSIVTTIGYVGGLFGPAFIGFLAEATSLSFAFAIIALLLVAVAAAGRSIIPVPSVLSKVSNG